MRQALVLANTLYRDEVYMVVPLDGENLVDEQVFERLNELITERPSLVQAVFDHFKNVIQNLFSDEATDEELMMALELEFGPTVNEDEVQVKAIPVNSKRSVVLGRFWFKLTKLVE
jgi:hypothetical protein